MHVYIYEIDIIVDLMYWIMYDMILLSESIDSLNVVIHHSIYCDNHDGRWIQMFSRLQSNLFSDGKYIVAFTLETSVQQFFKYFLWFFKLPYDTFYPFPGWINNKMFKNGIHNCFNI